MAAAIGGLLGGLGKNPAGGTITSASLQSSGMSTVQTFFQKGFPIGWAGLFILAGGIPFPPFSYLGYGGLNLWAAGSMSYFAMKGAFQAMCLVASHFVSVYYPKVWWLSYLMVFNPWYVFDLVQMFSPTFVKEGFKLPIYHNTIGATGGTGTVNIGILSAAVALFGTGAYSLINLLPTEIQSSYKPMLNTTLALVGGVSAVAGGGIGGVVLIPQILTALKGTAGIAEVDKIASVAKLDATLTSGASYASAPSYASGVSTVSAPSYASAPSSFVSPSTGNMTGGGNVELPSLESVANNILQKKLQSGGGAPVDQVAANIFLGALAVTALGGISLALVRSKAVSYGSSE